MTSPTPATVPLNLLQALRVARTLVLVMRGGGTQEALRLHREALAAHGEGDLQTFVAFALAREVVEDCLASVHPWPQDLQEATDRIEAELASAQEEAGDVPGERGERALVTTLLDFMSL